MLPRPPSSHTCPAQPLHPRMYREDSPQPLPSGTFTPSLLLLFFSELSPSAFPPPRQAQIPQQLINAANHHTGTAHGAHG